MVHELHQGNVPFVSQGREAAQTGKDSAAEVVVCGAVHNADSADHSQHHHRYQQRLLTKSVVSIIQGNFFLIF